MGSISNNGQQATRWKAVSLLVREKRAIPLIKKTFAQHDIEIYSPKFYETIFHRGRRKFVATEKRMIPKILLIRFGEEDENLWQQLRELSCVAYILKGCATDEEVQRLKGKEQQLKTRKPIKLDFGMGDQVRIVEGAMAGTTGTIKGISINRKKAQVGVDMFGRETLIEADTNALELVET